MTSLIQDIVALLAITNPLAAVPVFLAITEALSPAERSRAGLRAAAAVMIILGIVALVGRAVLTAFAISMPALQAAGGLVVLLMGLEMLHGMPTKVQHDEETQGARAQVLVPLVMPLMAGPGAITTVLTLSSRVGTWQEMTILLVAIGVVGATIGVALGMATRLSRVFGPRGQRILLRFMGLILAAVGAEILLEGVYTFEPEE